MDYTQKEILDLLIKIKEICESNNGCADCPFGRRGGICKIVEKKPFDWEITGHGAWRAMM